MRPEKDQIDRIEEAFKAVHGRKAAISASPGWEARVMRAVRHQDGQLAGKSFDGDWLGHLVWRFALATCLVAIFFTAVAVAIEPGAGVDLARLFFEDPLAFDLVNTLEAV